ACRLDFPGSLPSSFCFTSAYLPPEPTMNMNEAEALSGDTNLRVAARKDRSDVPPRFRHLLCLDDFEEPARRILPRPIFGYVAGGVETNTARDRNRSAFADWDLLPRVLCDTRGRHQKTTLFGRTYDLPFGFAPMGGTSLAAYLGDTVLAE